MVSIIIVEFPGYPVSGISGGDVSCFRYAGAIRLQAVRGKDIKNHIFARQKMLIK